MTTVTGTVERRDFGPGVWVLVGDDGTTYELRVGKDVALTAGRRARVEGEIRDDIASFAMVGPVFEVSSFAEG